MIIVLLRQVLKYSDVKVLFDFNFHLFHKNHNYLCYILSAIDLVNFRIICAEEEEKHFFFKFKLREFLNLKVVYGHMSNG